MFACAHTLALSLTLALPLLLSLSSVSEGWQQRVGQVRGRAGQGQVQQWTRRRWPALALPTGARREALAAAD
jgi:hypothetical protein